MKVLVVDDDAITREMLGYALTEVGYEVDAAADGREALRIIREQSHRLVISDWDMPHMNGVELCRAIRSEDLNGYVYFILLTKHGAPQQIVEGLSAGADDYITKPFENAELQMRLRAGERILNLETRDVAIFALAKLAESRDPETGAHLERVRSYSRVVAEHLSTLEKFQDEIDARFLQLIYQTSPLHDIGKVAIPDCVLLKADRLTEREYEIMQTHAAAGAETLDAALRQYPHAQFLIMARDIALTHHERWDGTGYPEGLAGEQIPLCGRIVALADVYDALTSKRVYKDAFGHDVARAIILGECGNHFDPDVVAAFTANEDRFVEIREHYRGVDAAATANLALDRPPLRVAG